jgi:DNA polymerase III epsilon subunit-like protein
MAITITEASKQFHNFVFKHANQQKLIPAGHNVSFDIDAIKHHLLVNNSDFSKHSWERYFSHRMIDTAVIANFLKLAKKIPKNVNNLENLASHYGIIIKDGQIHNAKTDVQISLEVLKRQIHCVQ